MANLLIQNVTYEFLELVRKKAYASGTTMGKYCASVLVPEMKQEKAFQTKEEIREKERLWAKFPKQRTRPLKSFVEGVKETPKVRQSRAQFKMPKWSKEKLLKFAEAEPGGLMACSPELLTELKEAAKTDAGVALTLRLAGVELGTPVPNEVPTPGSDAAFNPYECPDCCEAMKHAYSDATTPGFFYDRCEKHRKLPVGTPDIRNAVGVVTVQEMSIEEAKRRFPNAEVVNLPTSEFVCINCGLPEAGHVGDKLYCNNSFDPDFRFTPKSRSVLRRVAAQKGEPAPEFVNGTSYLKKAPPTGTVEAVGKIIEGVLSGASEVDRCANGNSGVRTQGVYPGDAQSARRGALDSAGPDVGSERGQDVAGGRNRERDQANTQRIAPAVKGKPLKSTVVAKVKAKVGAELKPASQISAPIPDSGKVCKQCGGMRGLHQKGCGKK